MRLANADIVTGVRQAVLAEENPLKRDQHLADEPGQRRDEGDAEDMRERPRPVVTIGLDTEHPDPDQGDRNQRDQGVARFGKDGGQFRMRVTLGPDVVLQDEGGHQRGHTNDRQPDHIGRVVAENIVQHRSPSLQIASSEMEALRSVGAHRTVMSSGGVAEDSPKSRHPCAQWSEAEREHVYASSLWSRSLATLGMTRRNPERHQAVSRVRRNPGSLPPPSDRPHTDPPPRGRRSRRARAGPVSPACRRCRDASHRP